MKRLASVLSRVLRKTCRHAFAIEDLKIVNPEGLDDRVEWPCAKCKKVFAAHCGLDISPGSGPTFRRSQNGKAVGDE